MEFPPDEADRIAALIRYGILDTEFEPAYDRMTRLAANLFETPVAAMSLIDGTRQWFKSAVGTGGIRETPREWAFCHHVVLGKCAVVVPDAAQDPRFRNNPLVAEQPRIRFYAGAPLTTPDGYTLGSLCVIDLAPRPPLTERQQRVLEDLAALVMDELELRRAALDGGVNRATAAMMLRLREPLENAMAAAETLASEQGSAALEVIRNETSRALWLLDSAREGGRPG